jgi:PAS domain S-box-containing protein
MISANAAMTGSYDYSEVARSVLIAIAASYAALDLAGRVTAASGRARLAWLSGGATAMGIGIWAMHFKGMLAFHLPVFVEYHWPTVLLSLVVAILASAFALYVVSRQKLGPVHASTGSVIMGSGIAGMHYIGVAAMRLPAITQFSLLLVSFSLFLAILFSLIALLMAFDLREETRWSVPRRLGSATLMGVAVSAMHYSGMAAVSFIPGPPPDFSHAVSISALGNNGIAIVTLIVIVAAMVTSSVDRRAGAEVRRLNQDLEQRVVERTQQLKTFNRALEAVNHALRKEIAEHKRAEEALRRSEDRLQLVTDTLPALVWSKLPDGSADFLNQRFREYTGLPVENGLGWGWMNAFHPEDRLEQEWREAFAAGKPFEKEARLRRADGEYHWFLLRGAPLRNESGKIVKWYGTTTDIEDRKLAEERSWALIDAIPQQIWSGPPDGSLDFCNARWRSYMGLTQEELQGEGWQRMLHPDDRERVLKAWREAVTNATPYEQEERHRGADGQYRWFLSRGVPLRNSESRIVRWYGTNTDIEERKRTEAALQEAHANLARVTRVVAMGGLAGAIAHQVNQPLAAIVTNANFCLRQLVGAPPSIAKLREAIAEITNDGTRASAVISRIRALLQKGVPERVELDVNQIIEEVAVLLRDELTRNRVSLRTDLGADIPRVCGDHVQLQQVLINLIMNGIEAMRSFAHPSRELFIKSASNHNGVLIQVQDSGQGLDPQQVEHIFEPFFTTKPEGIGMGLSISQSIVESHGGRLWAESGPEGALFQFTLPVK